MVNTQTEIKRLTRSNSDQALSDGRCMGVLCQ